MVTPVQLPIWREAERGLPNAFARSALFNVAQVRKGERRYFERETVAALNGITITYTGKELRQDDEDVFMQILHIGRMHALGTEVQFTAHGMLGELGWTRNTGSYQRLEDCLERLKATSLGVIVEGADGVRERFHGSLIRLFRGREQRGQDQRWQVLLEPEIVALFGPSSYSRVDWQMRLSLPPLAKWLHSFYLTHAQPFPITVALLHRLTGSEIKELRQFRYKLKQALELLHERGFFASAAICPRQDVVRVARSRAEAAQLEHDPA